MYILLTYVYMHIAMLFTIQLELYIIYVCILQKTYVATLYVIRGMFSNELTYMLHLV